MSAMVDDLLAETGRRIALAGPAAADDVRGWKGALAGFSPGMESDIKALKAFLFQRMYRHPRVTGTMGRAKEVVADLYAALSGDPSLLPPDWSQNCGQAGDAATGGVVRDYIAGMTDRFALSEYARIFHREIDLSAP